MFTSIQWAPVVCMPSLTEGVLTGDSDLYLDSIFDAFLDKRSRSRSAISRACGRRGLPLKFVLPGFWCMIVYNEATRCDVQMWISRLVSSPKASNVQSRENLTAHLAQMLDSVNGNKGKAIRQVRHPAADTCTLAWGSIDLERVASRTFIRSGTEIGE